MSDTFQPGDFFVEYSPTMGEAIARGIVLKVVTVGEHQLLTIEYQDCPTWLGMRSRVNRIMAFWCKKVAAL